MFFPWLIKTGDYRLEKDKFAEKYAILSHRWEDDEVKFNTMQPGDLQRSRKIKGACDLARAAKYEYIWIDSVCMDKSNAVETARNINSMFEYYQNAEVCITYLSDVDVTKTGSKRFAANAKENSVWFTRGWTLQELLASPSMWFYDKNWQLIGDKDDESIKRDLSAATKINSTYLNGDLSFRNTSVATRMSWMAGRTTTHIEDIAYSMFGILGVTMDPQYGEGANAFLRLQRVLLEGPRDESIFAWTSSEQGLTCYSRTPTTPTPPWTPSSWGLLAPSPNCFRNSWNVVVPSSEDIEEREYGWVQNGVRFMVPQKSGTDVTNWLGLPRKQIKFALNCRVRDSSNAERTVVIHLVSKDGINYVRVRCDTLDPTSGAKPSSNRVLKIDQMIRRPLMVGQPQFVLGTKGQASDENPNANAPGSASRLKATNMALASQMIAAANRGS